MDKKLKIIFIVLAIFLVIILGILIIYDILNERKYIDCSTNYIENSNNNNNLNNINQELLNELSNSINNNETTSNTIIETPPNIITNEKLTTNEQKAIDIVKRDWGEDDTVYFTKVGTDNDGRYIITVNNRYTTAAIMWYTVDVNTGKFFKQ